MALDPIAAQQLEQMKAMGGPPITSLEPSVVRQGMNRAPLPPGPELPQVEDMEAPGPEGPIPVRIFWPREADPEALQPATIWFHGGGWTIGSVASEDLAARHLAKLSDSIVISVDYRLAPEDPYPAAVDDAYAAVVWAVQNAPRMGIDAERVAVAGYSAGGNLAAVVAQLLRDRGGPTIRHQVLVNAVTDCGMDTGSYDEMDGYVLSKDLMTWFYGHYVPEGVDRSRADISPLQGELAGLPSTTIVNAECDPLCDEGGAYAAALEAAGVAVERRVYEGQIHTFLTNCHIYPQGMAALEYIGERLKAAFAE